MVLGVVDVASNEEVEEVSDGVDASFDGNTKLTGRKEVGGKRRAKVCHDDGTGDTAPAGANY